MSSVCLFTKVREKENEKELLEITINTLKSEIKSYEEQFKEKDKEVNEHKRKRDEGKTLRLT